MIEYAGDVIRCLGDIVQILRVLPEITRECREGSK